MIGRRIIYDTAIPTFETRCVLNSTQAAAIFVTEFDVLPALPGFCYRPILFHVNKEAGAYGIAAVTAIQVILGTVADNNPVLGIAPTGWLDQAGDLTRANVTKGNGIVADLGAFDISAGANKKIALRTAGAALSGAGGNLNVTILYTIIPVKYTFPSS